MIKVSGGYLNPIPSTRGLKQGGVLSSRLFNIFIDDINLIFDESCEISFYIVLIGRCTNKIVGGDNKEKLFNRLNGLPLIRRGVWHVFT